MMVYIVTPEFIASNLSTNENGFELPFRQLTTDEWVIPSEAELNLPLLNLSAQGFEVREISMLDFKQDPA